MPMTVSNPRDLVMHLLSDTLFVERMLSFEVLPSLLGSVQDPELAGALARHLEQTKRHVEDVERVFRSFGAEPSSAHSLAFGGLKEQHDQMSGSVMSPQLADLFHADSAARTERYEIGAYSTLVELSRSIGNDEAVALLERNLADEREALGELERAIGALAQARAD